MFARQFGIPQTPILCQLFKTNHVHLSSALLFWWQHEARPLQQDSSPRQIVVVDDTDSDNGAGPQSQQGDAGDDEGGPGGPLILASEQQRLQRMYPNSIQTSDIKHVVDNILGECLGVMHTCLRLWIKDCRIPNCQSDRQTPDTTQELKLIVDLSFPTFSPCDTSTICNHGIARCTCPTAIPTFWPNQGGRKRTQA